MWMMEYNDRGDFKMPDSFDTQKLRPLIHRSNNNTAMPTSSSLSRFNGNDLLALNIHLAEQSKKEMNTQQFVASSRWNPTPEQLQTLEELYRQGIRTPSADQIQHITSQLRRYGKIEGKNVFYWFQNHKARERQKRRRQLQSVPQQLHHIENKESSGANIRTCLELEQTKNWAPPSNSSTLSERTVSIQRATKVAECGWVETDEGELQQRRSLNNSMWKMMQLPCSPPNCTATVTTTTTTTVRTMDPKLLFIQPYRDDLNYTDNVDDDHGAECGGSQTLQLFPIGSSNGDGNNDDAEEEEEESEISIADMDVNFTPYQFFEFLPLRN